MLSFNGRYVQFGLFWSDRTCRFVLHDISQSDSFISKLMWTIKMVSRSDNPNKTQLCYNRVQKINFRMIMWLYNFEIVIFKGLLVIELLSSCLCKVMDGLSSIHVFIFSRIDRCNSNKAGISQNSLCHLQQLYNAAQCSSLLSNWTVDPPRGSPHRKILGWLSLSRGWWLKFCKLLRQGTLWH